MNKMRFVAKALCVASSIVALAACAKTASNQPAPSSASATAATAPVATAQDAPAKVTDVASAAPSAPEDGPIAANSSPARPSRAKEAVSAAPRAVAVAPPVRSAEPTSPPPSAEPVIADASSDLARRLDAVFADAKTFRARFEQSYTIAVQGVEKRSTGTVIVARPGKLAFLYDAPNGNRVVSDGKELHVYDAGSQQDIVQPVAKAQLPGAFGFLMGKGVADAFHFQQNPNAKAGEVLLLGKPIEATPAYERVQFAIDTAKLEKKDVGALKGVLIVDAQKNKNRFTFTDSAVPGAVGDGAFTFAPPAGTSIKRL